MKRLCSFDNFACQIDNFGQDLTLPIGIAIAFIAAIAIATILKD